jgi:predicted lipoprotein with Yx(FWY)xxD motif
MVVFHLKKGLAVLALILIGSVAFSMGKTESVGIEFKKGLHDFLIDSKGITLYYFAKDREGVSNWRAPAGSPDQWPAFYTSDINSIATALDASDFGTITRPDGTLQTTYRGFPLYYYAGDKAPLDTNGQGLGQAWFVVNPVTFVGNLNDMSFN